MSEFQRAKTIYRRKAKPNALRLWTIQPYLIWEKLLESRCLYSEPTSRYIKSWPHAYDWMREQMSKRLSEYEGHYPWWAYVSEKPDLRTYYARRGESGTKYVRIELSLDPSKVLLHDADDWVCILNRGIVAFTRDEWESWHREIKEKKLYSHPLPEPWLSRLHNSWERCFDLENLSWIYEGPPPEVHGVFECLRLSDVVTATLFTSR